MKECEFKNVKNGILITYSASPLLFNDLLAALRDYAGKAKAAPAPRKFRLSAVESYEEFNEKHLGDDMPNYVLEFRFVLIYEGEGLMTNDELEFPPYSLFDNRVQMDRCYEWLNEYWLNRELPVSNLFYGNQSSDIAKLRQAFQKCPPDNLKDVENLGWFHDIPEEKRGAAAVYHYYDCDEETAFLKVTDRHGDPEKPTVVFSVAKNPHEIPRLCCHLWYNGKINQGLLAADNLLESNAAFDALPFAEKSRLLNYALDKYRDWLEWDDQLMAWGY